MCATLGETDKTKRTGRAPWDCEKDSDAEKWLMVMDRICWGQVLFFHQFAGCFQMFRCRIGSSELGWVCQPATAAQVVGISIEALVMALRAASRRWREECEFGLGAVKHEEACSWVRWASSCKPCWCLGREGCSVRTLSQYEGSLLREV